MGKFFYFVKAKYDYIAQGSNELDLRRTEKCLLLDDSNLWWHVLNTRGQSGYVPSNYVKREKHSIFNSLKRKVLKKISTGSKSMPTSPSRSSLSAAHSSARDPIGTAIVKYNYQPQKSDELGLEKGRRIFILEKSNDGWWRGQFGRNVGWFPSNYTREENGFDTE